MIFLLQIMFKKTVKIRLNVKKKLFTHLPTLIFTKVTCTANRYISKDGLIKYFWGNRAVLYSLTKSTAVIKLYKIINSFSRRVKYICNSLTLIVSQQGTVLGARRAPKGSPGCSPPGKFWNIRCNLVHSLIKKQALQGWWRYFFEWAK